MKIQNAISFIKKLRTNGKASRRSFKVQLIFSFIVVSILPLVIMQLYSYYNITASMRENIDEMIDINLLQTRKSLSLTLSSYEDFLYQIYTNDEIIENMNNINEDHEVAVNINQLRRRLRSFSNAKATIQCVTLITSSGKVIAYDKLSPTTLESSWLDEKQKQQPDLYSTIKGNKGTTIIPTGDATQFGMNPYYLFHLAHRMIDYRDIFKDVGLVVISLDESVLAEACNESVSDVRTSMNFIISDEGKLVSFLDRSRIGSVVSTKAEDKDALRLLVQESKALAGAQIAIKILRDEKTGWLIVNAADQSDLFERLQYQQRIAVLVGLLAALTLIAVILLITGRLSGSITKVVKAMKAAGGGELTIRIPPEKTMPMEIQTIADQFNKMIEKIYRLINEVKSATFKQKEAEIRALEAQINPHFLYNTLDTINWMAIEKDEHEISSMINALARILRYGVDKSNAVVTVREEVDWLRQYIYLQQTRLKNAFEFKTDIDESVMGCKIHKLLIQPFVENSILHGFYGKKGKCVLTISIKDRDEYIEIEIEDNGIGMSEKMVASFNQKELRDEQIDHIGIGNVQSRLEMYYGEKASVHASSNENGTCIILLIAKF